MWLPKEDEITKAERICWGESFSLPLSHAACLGKVSHSGHLAWQKCGPTRTRPGSRDLYDIIRRRESQGSATPVFCSLKEILKKSIKNFIFNKVIQVKSQIEEKKLKRKTAALCFPHSQPKLGFSDSTLFNSFFSCFFCIYLLSLITRL